MVRVSVIMGAYNCATTIGKSIESIQAQSFRDWEFIICDDCSTDTTCNVVQNYIDNDARIKLIHNDQNSRLAYSLNHCLSVASGEFIARMDADDISFPDRLEKQVSFLDTHPEYAVVGGGVVLFDETGVRNQLLNTEIPTVQCLKSEIPFFHPTILMRKIVYDELGGYLVLKRTRRGQDMDLWFRFFAKGYRGYNLQEPVIKYHDSLNDYNKKSSFSYAWGTTKTKLIGFRMNRFPLYEYPWAFIPVIKLFIPKSVLYQLHELKSK